MKLGEKEGERSQVACEEENEGKIMKNEENRGLINKNGYEDQFVTFLSILAWISLCSLSLSLSCTLGHLEHYWSTLALEE